jgi:hypothetical protein
VTEGVAVTTDPVVVLSPVPGLHEYVLAPEATSAVLPPSQITALLTLSTGAAFTVTVVVAAFVQPLLSVPEIV